MIVNTLSITTYMHCRQCLHEIPENTSPQEYSSLDVGLTKQGLQVWCRRHQANIYHVDFEGRQHPANIRRDERAVSSPTKLRLV